MKGHMFCASQASTAICLSTDHIHKPTSSSAVSGEERGGGGRTTDRHKPVIREVGRRSFTVSPCSSVDDVPYSLLQKTKVPSSAGEVTNIRKLHKGRKSSSGRSSGGGGTAASLFKLIADDISLGRKSFSSSRAVPGSSRYLLSSDPDSVPGSPSHDSVYEASEPKRGSNDAVQEGETEKKTSSSSSPDQVVVLRVSLHCKGCEAKVRKHLSRMQGVTSFNIDFTSKKVTVTGDITPLEVLDSISKIKNAQFWTSSSSSSSSSSLPNANPEASKQ